MKIEKGQKYLCVSEDVYLDNKPNQLAYRKGKIYVSEIDKCITDELGNKDHEWDYKEHGYDWRNCFQPLSSAKWAIKRTPENADEVNRWANEKRMTVYDEGQMGVWVHSDRSGYLKQKDGYTEIDLNTFREITGMGEEKEFKIGDWVIGWHNITSSFDYHKKAWVIGKIETIDELNGCWVHVKNIDHNTRIGNIRHATREEIAAATQPKKPKQTSGEKEVVHCPTLELAEKVIEILKDNGKNPSFEASVYFNEKGTELCFRAFGYFGYAYKEFYQREGYTIIPAEKFIKDNEPKIFTIEDVRNGKCAIENDGTAENLNTILNYAYGSRTGLVHGRAKYYFNCDVLNSWTCDDETHLPTQSVKLFLKQIEGELPQDYNRTVENVIDANSATLTTDSKLGEEWQPKWGEPIQYKTDYGEWYDSFYVASTLDKESHYVEDADGCYTTAREIRQIMKTFTIDKVKQDLAKLHNINVNQVEIK